MWTKLLKNFFHAKYLISVAATLINTDDKLPDAVILKNVVTLMTCVKKDDGKFYQKILLQETLYIKQAWKKEISIATKKMAGLVHARRQKERKRTI